MFVLTLHGLILQDHPATAEMQKSQQQKENQKRLIKQLGPCQLGITRKGSLLRKIRMKDKETGEMKDEVGINTR